MKLFSVECLVRYEGHVSFIVCNSYKKAKALVTRWAQDGRGDEWLIKRIEPGDHFTKENLLANDREWQASFTRYKAGEEWT